MATGKSHRAAHAHRLHHRHPRPKTLPHFIQIAPAVMADLISAFDLSPVQAAAILGNLGTESDNFTAYHQHGERENRGGYGWAQWTGHRRKTFFAWADTHGLARDSAAASLGYLKHELQTSYRHVLTELKRQTNLAKGTDYFMHKYEGAGVFNERSRQTHAAIALDAYIRTYPAQGGVH